MRVVVAPDKFRGSLSAPEAARAIGRGVVRARADARVDLVPMADGGEGTVEALVSATGGAFRESVVSGPLGEPVPARFGRLGDGTTAAIEMAAASGLGLLSVDCRDPRRATTRGTGELLLAAVADGASRVVMGIGGSATNDGGAGLAQALGVRLLDAEGHEIGPGGGALSRLDRIDSSGRDRRLDGVEVAVACDVDNPLCGPKGASAVYGPQKGADPATVEELDRNLDRLARIVERDLGILIRDLPGAGAAGGLGGGLVAFAGGRLERGVELVLRAVGLEDRLRDADLCLTGEGRIDGSSASGKTAVGVSRLARRLGCPTIALAGALGEGAEAVLAVGVSAYFSLCPGPISMADSLSHAADYLEKIAEQAVRSFLAGEEAPGRRGHSGVRP